MKNSPVIPAIVLLVVGVGLGLLWHRLERGSAPEPLQQEADPAPATVPAAGAPGIAVSARTSTMHVTRVVNAARNAGGTALDALTNNMEVRQALGEMYPNLGTELQLTDEEAAGFLDLLARRQNAISAEPNARQLDIMDQMAEGEQAAVLGSKFQQWKEYRENELQGDPIDKMQSLLVAQNMGLTTQEVNPLVDALAAEQERLTRELVSAPGANRRTSQELFQLQVPRAAADNKRLVQVASRYLNPRQLEVYERLLRQRQLGMERKLRAMQRTGPQEDE